MPVNCETVGFVDHHGDLLAAPVQNAASWRICHELKIAEIKIDSVTFRLRSELRSCVKVEVAVMGSRPQKAYGFCGRKATLDQPTATDAQFGVNQQRTDDDT